MKRYTVYYFFLFFALHSDAQSIDVIVKKGKIRIGSRFIYERKKESFGKSDVLEVFTNSIVFAVQDKKFINLSNAKKYTFSDVHSMFKSTSSSKPGLLKILLNVNYKIQQESGVTMRGEEEVSDPKFYLPTDSFIVLNQPVKLIIGKNIDGPSSNVVVCRLGSTDTVKLPPSQNEYKIDLSEPGIYHWEYSVTTDSKIYRFRNVFFMPNKKEKKRILTDLNIFKKDISDYNLDTQRLLLDEYYELHRLYGMD